MKWLTMLMILISTLAWGKSTPPQSLIDEANDALIIHKGPCEFPGYTSERCIIGIDPNTEVLWVLLFDERGDLYQVLNVTDKDGIKVKSRWIRDNRSS